MKTNLQMLIFGAKHIAKNHNFKFYNNIKEDGSLFLMGDWNIPTIADLQMLCEDCGMGRNVYYGSFGIEVYLPISEEGGIDEEWANKEYVKPFNEFWRRMV